MALTKKSLNNFLPNGFETQNKDGYKANFTNDRIISGFEKDTLEVLSGPNLNNFIDKTGKNFNTLNDLLEYFNAMPIDSFPIVNASNQLDYKSINSFFRNVGELVFSSVPIDDKNLHLADGTLLDGKGTYRVFVDFIGGLSSKYPSLFTDEATWQATVKKYGTCAKYVWDATNKTLRIPRLKGLIEATIDKDSIGNITEAGLPNITGTAHFSQEQEAWNAKDWYDGAFFLKQRKGNGVDGTHGAFDLVGFDASRSSQVYGKSNTVQPQTVKQYIYIVVSVDTEETTKLTSVFQYRGSVSTFDELPTEGNITGDVWNVEDTNVNYVWDGAEWDPLAGSVDLSGYYTKEQADTRFATVTSLESNVENLQSKITQNTTDIASLGLGSVISSSLEKGKALKYLETKGNITEDADVYNDVYNYKHSSFDINKFTAVGNPTITEDGIITVKKSSDYVICNAPNLGELLHNAKTWKIEFETIFSRTTSNFTSFFKNVTGYSIVIGKITDTFYFDLSSNNTSWDIADVGIDGVRLEDGKLYRIVIEFTGSQYIGSIYTSTGSFVKNRVINSTLKVYPAQNYRIMHANPVLDTPIDLKKLSITVDGKEVFNGNKTGLDIVKPDNYTVVGSPTISEDGIIYETENNNYVKIPCIFADDFEFEISWTNKPEKFWWGYLISGGLEIYHYHGNGVFQVNLRHSGTFTTICNIQYIKGAKYKVHIKKTSASLVVDAYINNELSVYGTLDLSEIATLPTFTTIKVCENNFDTKDTTMFYPVEVDLNNIKIWQYGSLSQPCLKIPYNISKTGLKVANADTRERIIGMGEDYGYSQYFTIDEENKNATLPIGAGITGRQDLIASFDDGTNKYEQFSDLTFKQSGKCTANTAVTFIQPYKDEKYKLSVPYSAKTKTGFTPTVSGDWFAEGKIYLD